MSWSRTRAGFIAAVTIAFLGGCATVPEGKRDPKDPWERMNRATYRFNSAVDRAVLKPLATAYNDHVPQTVRTGVSNFVDNLEYPITVVNDFLQGKFGAGVRDTGRLLLNSTVGIGGLIDVASKAGLDENDEDFGQTLGRWGVPSGPYLVLPFIGPSTLRDAPSLYADSRLYIPELLEDEVEEFRETAVEVGLVAINVIDTRARLLNTERVLKSTYDEYAFVRNAWLQRREYNVRDGEVDEELLEDEELMEEEEPADDAAGDPPAGDEEPSAEEPAAQEESAPPPER